MTEIEAVSEKTKVAEPVKEIKFDADSFMKNLTELMKSDSVESKNKLDDLVNEVWSIPTEKGFYSNNSLFDAGAVSKMSSVTMGGKRIAGTQRLIAPPPPSGFKKNMYEVETMMNKPGSAQLIAAPPMIKKKKMQMPVIDDSIASSSDQPCKVCQGVSVAGNTVLACSVCSDTYHMKCNKYAVSMDDATNPRYVFVCAPCIKPKIGINKQRGSSPQVRAAEIDKRAKTSLEEYKKRKMREGKL